MSSNNVIWPDATVPNAVKKWVIDFFAIADSKEEDSARKFAGFFHVDGVMVGMTGPLQGREGAANPNTGLNFMLSTDPSTELAIYESRLQAWNTVKSRTHTIQKVYTNKKDASDILILGVLYSTLNNGRSFEMEFAAQALFEDTTSDPVEATHYKVWAVSHWSIRQN
ncbi:hypothetical protein H2198_002623 [Neophaeococcomyces mojaviensis]|uniref:Uncharacterized protein n=1 Tax=Neophaeococcomyces mojaviensis TaxID=3383035 RepID=A0ACC3ADN6_9EURO|nr:hypothetical protein H2198_002623 [Knufia sp. JES_112]